MVLLHILTEITDMNDDFTELQMSKCSKQENLNPPVELD